MVNNLIKKHEKFIKYLIFGVLTTIVSIVSYALCAKVFQIHFLLSNTISWIISVLFAYVTNKLYVFKSNGKVDKEIFKFFMYRIASLLIETIIMYIFVDILKINDIMVKIIAQFIVILLNYIFSKLYVFKSGEKVKYDR